VTEALKEALKDQDADAAKLNAASESVMTVFSRVGQAMYQQAQASGGQAASGGDAGQGASADEAAASSDEDEVVEGEIVEEGDAS